MPWFQSTVYRNYWGYLSSFPWNEVKWSEVAQSRLTHCHPMDYSLPGSSVHGIFQARILEWVAISFSRGSSRPRDWTRVSHIVGRCFTIWATREAHEGDAKPIWTLTHHHTPFGATHTCLCLSRTDGPYLVPLWTVIYKENIKSFQYESI